MNYLTNEMVINVYIFVFLKKKNKKKCYVT